MAATTWPVIGSTIECSPVDRARPEGRSTCMSDMRVVGRQPPRCSVNADAYHYVYIETRKTD